MRKNTIWKILLSLFLVGAVLGGVGWGVHLAGQSQAEKRMAELAAQTEQNDPESGRPSEERTEQSKGQPEEGEDEVTDPLEKLVRMGIPIPDKEVDFERLAAEENPDIYAWIYIPDSAIDYPVLQHPEDNVYYLNHNVDHSKGYPGCIYSENYNEKDFSDPNTVLYGHNMKNGSMFAGLHQFEDEEYFTAHPYVYVYTPERLYVYEVFAAYEFSNLHLLLNYDFENEVIFQKYLDDVYDTRSMNCNIKEDLEVTAEDKILTLSTCIKNKPDNRYLVQGVLLNED